MKKSWLNQQRYFTVIRDFTVIRAIAFAILILLFPRIAFAEEVKKSEYFVLETNELEISPSFLETLFSEPLTSKDFLIDPSLSFNTYSTNHIAQANTYDGQIINSETGILTNEKDKDQIPLEESPAIPIPNELKSEEQPLNQSNPISSSPETEMGGQSLSEAANDPTASLMSLQIYDSYTTNFHKLSGSANTVVFRPVIPFKLGDTNNILRITAPIITSNPILDSGLSDLTIFNLLVFNESWGRWGVGPVALIPTGGGNRGAEKWALGPAIGFTAMQGKLLWGLFNQNLFSFAGDSDRQNVNLSILQPILFYGLGNGWSIGNSEMSITYDWETSRFSSLPLVCQYNSI
jgi:hypothetical protein